MSRPTPERSWSTVASNVLKRSLGLRRGQSVLFDTHAETLQPAELLSVEARRQGIRPVILCVPEDFYATQTRTTPSNANAISPVEVAALQACDGYVYIPPSLENLQRREELPLRHRRATYRRSAQWNQELLRRSVPSVYLLDATVTRSAATQYDVNFSAWRRESSRASSVDPRVLQRAARPLARQLQRGRRVTIDHPNGTHLELALVGRPPILDDGMVDADDRQAGRIWTTIPSGLLTVAVEEGFAEGHWFSNRPSRHRRGAIRRMGWTFRKGRLVHYEIGEGRNIFEANYRSAGAERNRPALVSVGLNSEIRNFPLAEDQERGVVTLYVGHNDDFGGRTRGSFREYALLRGADLTVDGRPLLRAGRWV